MLCGHQTSGVHTAIFRGRYTRMWWCIHTYPHHILVSPFPAEIHNSCIFLHMSPKSLRANFNVPKMVLLEEKSPPLPRCHNWPLSECLINPPSQSITSSTPSIIIKVPFIVSQKCATKMRQLKNPRAFHQSHSSAKCTNCRIFLRN